MSATALALLGGAGKAATTWYQNRQAAKQQHEAQDFSAQQYATRYQTQVKDMKKAGLNPMLAAGASPGSAPTGQAAPVQEMPVREAIQDTTTATAQQAKMKQETINLKFEQKNIEAMQDKLNMEIAKTGNEVMEIDQKIKTGRASEQEIILRQELTKKQSQLTDMQFKLATQSYNIQRPEEIASATRAAEYSAQVQKVLQPIIDALGGVSKVRKPK